MSEREREPTQLEGACAGFSTYWRIYGGWTALRASPYFAAAWIFTALAFPLWREAGWWDTALSVLPAILGFSLGGFAILLAFGDETFRALISGSMGDEENKPSPYLKSSTTFLHFILLQVASILLALLAKAWISIDLPFDCLAAANEILRPIFWAVGFWFFVYSLFAAGAAVMAIFVLVRSFDEYHTERRREEDAKRREPPAQ